jgi:hypothetical protein
MFWLSAVCILAEAAVVLGDSEHAARIAPLLAPYADHHAQVGLAFYLGPVRGFRAELAALMGDNAAAAADLRAACAAAEAVGAVIEAARLRAAYDALPVVARDGG